MSEHVHAVHPEPDMVQLLTPEGQRVSHPDYTLDISDDESRQDIRLGVRAGITCGPGAYGPRQ